MTGDRPRDLVDRAYQVGDAATAAPAPTATYPDRRGVIRALGIIQIVFGGIAGLLALIVFAGGALGTRREMMVLSVAYAVPAANFLFTGIGSVRIARWARLATLISAGIWLALILLVSASFVLMSRTRAFGMSGGEATLMSVILVPLGAIALALPIVHIVVYTRPSVRATFARRQAS
jgi:hypothetical protein